tara:strand:- start:32 stop:229 length:198 start_codon:yes stop_codon:yes gene_type:complete
MKGWSPFTKKEKKKSFWRGDIVEIGKNRKYWEKQIRDSKKLSSVEVDPNIKLPERSSLEKYTPKP